MIAYFLERAFAVDFLFQPAQCLVYGFAFFKPDFGQLYSLPFWCIGVRVPALIARGLPMRRVRVAGGSIVSTGKTVQGSFVAQPHQE